jgi:type IV pilus assembly protein PilM
MMASVNGNGKSGSGISRLWRRVRMNPGLEWGCEISPSGVTLARWNGAASGSGTAAWRPLAPGAIEVSPVRENLLRPEDVRQALAGCLESLGRSATASSSPHAVNIALAIPDQSARVFFLTFDQFPSQPSQAVPLIRWKLKKSVPFEIDASTVSYVAHRAAAEWEVLTVVSPADIIRQYESVPESMGLKPRFVTLSTLGALGLVSSAMESQGIGAAAGSYLLAKYSPPWLTTTILHEGSVRLFRTVPIGSNGAAGLPPNSLREILETVHPSVAYFQDNFGRPLERAYLCGLGELSGTIADSLTTELNLKASRLLEESAPAVAGMDPPLAERHLAALMGISRVRRRA